MKKFDVVKYMLPVPNGKFEDVVHPEIKHIIHRQPQYDHVSVYAIVLGIHEQEDEQPLLDLAFIHPARETALNNADWRDAFDRVFGVRCTDHDDIDGNKAMGHYYLVPSEEDLKAMIAQYGARLRGALEDADRLREELLAAQKPVPSETKNYADGSSATGPAPLPDQSPEGAPVTSVTPVTPVTAPEPPAVVRVVKGSKAAK